MKTKKIKQYFCKNCNKEFIKYKSTDKVCSKGCLNELEKQKKRKIKEQKAISPKVLYKLNVAMAKKIAKIRDNFTCQWCGSKNNIHWSHIINEARDHRLATYEFNIKALCYNCHLSKWHKNILEASEWFNKKFPWKYEILNKLHIEYSKEWPITKDWHKEENERLKILLKEYENL